MYFTLLENILERNIKLSHVVLAKPVMIPANTLQQRNPDHGHLERDVPFWIQGLRYRGGRLSGISERNDQILRHVAVSLPGSGSWYHVLATMLTGSLVPPRSFGARSLP